MKGGPEAYKTEVAQSLPEVDNFIEILRDEGVTSYLEVGSQYGGALWRVANALPKGSRIVSVDLPYPGHGTDVSLRACQRALIDAGYDAYVFLGDSTDASIVDQVKALSPFGAVFIDANHTLPYVTKDWENYGPMGQIVAFHDIVWDKPVRPHRLPIEVRKLWLQIKDDYRHCEFSSGDGSDKGIGVLWR